MVPVVHIRNVGMGMTQRHMAVGMRVRLPRRNPGRMLVLVVLVMHVFVTVLQRIVGMFMRMLF